MAALLGLVLTAACASSRAVPQPFPRPGPARPPDTRPLSATDSALVDTALGLRGIPYRNGGADPSGFDCSGFVAYVFAQHGWFVPRTVGSQYSLGTAIDREDVRTGDLVFFTTVAPGASHVGIAISGTEFVHAPSSTGVVRVERLDERYWSSRFVGARRLP